MNKIIVIAILGLLWTGIAMAGEAKAVIHLYSDGALVPQELNGVTFIKQDKGPYSIDSKEKIGSDCWTDFSFTFIPQFTGKVAILPVGVWEKSPTKKNINQVWMYYDGLKVTGSTLKNGSFENNGENWSLCGKTPKAVIVKDSTLAADGESFLAAWLGSTYSQVIWVNKDVPVNISFKARYNETVPAQE
jgi:hypothetical protein